MGIQKVAAWANIGSFLVACLTLYLLLPSQPKQVSNGPSHQQLEGSGPVNPVIWVFMGVILISGGLHAYAASVQSRGQSAKKNSKDPLPSPSTALDVPASLPRPETVPTTIPEVAPSAPLFGTQTTLPDRVVVSCTIEELQDAYRTQTLIQITARLHGKWIKLSGKVDDISKTWLHVARPIRDSPLITCRFENKWAAQLERLTKDQTVEIRGKFLEASHTTFTLEECELL